MKALRIIFVFFLLVLLAGIQIKVFQAPFRGQFARQHGDQVAGLLKFCRLRGPSARG